MEWNYVCTPDAIKFWERFFTPHIYWACDYFSMLVPNLNHVSTRDNELAMGRINEWVQQRWRKTNTHVFNLEYTLDNCHEWQFVMLVWHHGKCLLVFTYICLYIYIYMFENECRVVRAQVTFQLLTLLQNIYKASAGDQNMGQQMSGPNSSNR